MMSVNPKLQGEQIIKGGKKGFPAGKPTDPSYPQSHGAESAHNMSQFVQAELTLSWPSVEVIKKSGRSEWTIPSVKAKIAELKIEHRQQLAKALGYQSVEEHQMYLEQFQTFEELEGWSGDAMELMKVFHRTERRLRIHQTEDFFSRLRYIHLMALNPLYKRLHKLLLAEETAKAQRARIFPKSSQGWREMDTRDAKLKVAKFLLLDKKQQDEMLSREPGWRDSKTDIDRVVLEYRSNIVFSQEVKNFAKENLTTDPRRRP